MGTMLELLIFKKPVKRENDVQLDILTQENIGFVVNIVYRLNSRFKCLS